MDANNTKPASGEHTTPKEEPSLDDSALLMIAKIRTERRERKAQSRKTLQKLGQKLATLFRLRRRAKSIKPFADWSK